MEKPKRKKLPSVERDKISKDKVAKISTDLFLYGKTRLRMGVRPFRLLCMVAQTLSSEKESPGQLSLFKTEYTYSPAKVFEYLGLENTNQRYELLISDMLEVMGTVIQYKTVSKRGAIRWKGINLLSYCDIDEETGRIVVQINESARGYLVGMNRWCALQPKYYLKLSTEYQNWFYVFLKKEAGVQPSITVDIDTLKEMLCLDETKSYNPEQNKNANENFFKYVLGIVKPKGWKYKPQGKNEPWDYTRDSKTKEVVGTLGTITKETDINVSAFPIKEGRTYTKVRFDISRKKATLSKVEQEQLHKKLTAFDIDDMGKPERKGRSKAKKPQSMADMFGSVPVLDEHKNPMADTGSIPSAKTVIPAKSVRETARHLGMTADQLATKLGYRKREDGDWEQ